MNNVQIILSDEQANALKKYVFEITREGIEAAKEISKINQPFLKQKFMAQFLGISVNTLIKWESQGLPTIIIDGTKLYSKQEVSKWILQHQR
ncbi:hypothetical protein LMF32_12030 [Desemzia sp. C1]|uniref:hypothetical protein n=1 Tax=Desemzia sp. C1 TaxID=2892016 RepID=UPI001E2E8848|nr:hypothetical protein [Desemzia sp. C1]MCI3029773.1 hypothetical protein [Desemzia sp. C1]